MYLFSGKDTETIYSVPGVALISFCVKNALQNPKFLLVFVAEEAIWTNMFKEYANPLCMDVSNSQSFLSLEERELDQQVRRSGSGSSSANNRVIV